MDQRTPPVISTTCSGLVADALCDRFLVTQQGERQRVIGDARGPEAAPTLINAFLEVYAPSLARDSRMLSRLGSLSSWDLATIFQMRTEVAQCLNKMHALRLSLIAPSQSVPEIQRYIRIGPRNCRGRCAIQPLPHARDRCCSPQCRYPRKCLLCWDRRLESTDVSGVSTHDPKSPILTRS